MIDSRLIKTLETIGYVNKNGRRIYGTATLLHMLHCPLSEICPYYIEQGKVFIHSLLEQ